MSELSKPSKLASADTLNTAVRPVVAKFLILAAKEFVKHPRFREWSSDFRPSQKGGMIQVYLMDEDDLDLSPGLTIRVEVRGKRQLDVVVSGIYESSVRKFRFGDWVVETDKSLKSQASEIGGGIAQHLDRLLGKGPGKSASGGVEKQAKLMSRQEKILAKYLEEVKKRGGRPEYDFDSLPERVRSELRKVKDQETLWSDVERWLSDHSFGFRWASGGVGKRADRTVLVSAGKGSGGVWIPLVKSQNGQVIWEGEAHPTKDSALTKARDHADRKGWKAKKAQLQSLTRERADIQASSKRAKFPRGVPMTVDEVADVVGPEFKEMNENPPESVVRVREEMEAKVARIVGLLRKR